MIPVTKPFIPPIEDYTDQVNRAFKNGWLTNRGELVRELEEKLKVYLELEESNILCLNNGTTPLQIALKLLGNGGEIITTPFSYVATTAAIVWENCTPVFVDIDPEYLTIDESKIEAAITDKTTCILATHVFGNPCNIEEIDRIAKKYDLKVIYDAAHCFGVKYNGKSIFEYGDVSTCSFHATKLFHTGEGGAIFTKEPELYEAIYYSHNFGHDGPYSFKRLGINGKMSELNAAMGLTMLPHMKKVITQRHNVVEKYKSILRNSKLELINIRVNTNWNYSYFPVLFHNEIELKLIEEKLLANSIVPRRYFYPDLEDLPYLKKNERTTSFANDISKRVLCLPLFHDLKSDEIELITTLITEK